MNRQKSHRCSSSDGSLFYIVLNYSSTAAWAAANDNWKSVGCICFGKHLGNITCLNGTFCFRVPISTIFTNYHVLYLRHIDLFLYYSYYCITFWHILPPLLTRSANFACKIKDYIPSIQIFSKVFTFSTQNTLIYWYKLGLAFQFRFQLKEKLSRFRQKRFRFKFKGSYIYISSSKLTIHSNQV